MKLIIGLGNPDEKYSGTRHNIGFDILDKIQKNWDFPEFSLENKFKAEISKKENVILVKPQTFMNLSGEATQEILNFYKLTSEDIIVIHDDLDIMIGEYKIATDSRSAGHNGVQNIMDKIGTQKITRLRIGVGEEKDGVLACHMDAHPPRVDDASSRVEAGDFVLQRFSESERKKIQDLEETFLEEIKKLL